MKMKLLLIMIQALASFGCASRIYRESLREVRVEPAPNGEGEPCMRYKGALLPGMEATLETMRRHGLELPGRESVTWDRTEPSCDGDGRVCPTCGTGAVVRQGQALSRGRCRQCYGKGTVTMSAAPITTMLACSGCSGTGGFRDYKGNWSKCWTCNGSGRVNVTQPQYVEQQCVACQASGRCPTCKGTGEGDAKCPICDGSGRVFRQVPGYLGVELRSDDLGPVIQRTLAGGAAQESGLQPGDLLLRLGERTMTGGDQSAIAALQEIQRHLAGHRLVIKYRRDGVETELEVRLKSSSGSE